MVEYIRKEDKSVLLLDGGALFDQKRDTAEFILKAMELMKYDVLNIGSPELQFGKEFLEHARSQVSFPYISSNLVYSGGRPPWVRDYIIMEKEGIRVAILGILDPDGLQKLPKQEKSWEAIPPESALQKLLPEVRQKADLVILLSQLSTANTLALVEAVKGIDVAISSGADDKLDAKLLPENILILPTGTQGKTMGLLKVTLDEKRVPSVSETMVIPLDNPVPDNEAIASLVETYKKEQEAKKEKQKNMLMENLKLTPEQFMELYRKEQNERIKGEAK